LKPSSLKIGNNLPVILDTNALSAIADNELAAVRIFRNADSIELPVIVLGEYRFGIAHSRRRGEYEKWLKELIAATRMLAIDEETSSHYARVRAELKKAGHPIPSNDIWIAALARQHKLAVMSRDGHFEAVDGIERVGW
jgi:tRNA(fMet)-specific endonuclease VapC